MTTFKSNITNNNVLYPDDISEKLSLFITAGTNYETWKKLDGQLYDGLYNLFNICCNPFNDDSYRILYDAISSAVEKLERLNLTETEG